MCGPNSSNYDPEKHTYDEDSGMIYPNDPESSEVYYKDGTPLDYSDVLD